MTVRRHAFARSLQTRAMPDRFTIRTPGTITNAGDGTWEEGITDVEGVAGRWKVLDGSERIVAGGIASIGDVLVELEAFQTVTPGAALIVAARDSEPAHTFSVKRALPRSDGWVTSVLCTEG